MKEWKRDTGKCNENNDNQVIEDKVSAVSYTHLDVYKRQKPHSCAPHSAILKFLL